MNPGLLACRASALPLSYTPTGTLFEVPSPLRIGTSVEMLLVVDFRVSPTRLPGEVGDESGVRTRVSGFADRPLSRSGIPSRSDREDERRRS